MAKKESIDLAIEKLDQIIKLLAYSISADPDKSISERGRILRSIGLDYQTIALILNTSPNSIKVLLSNLRTKNTGRK